MRGGNGSIGARAAAEPLRACAWFGGDLDFAGRHSDGSADKEADRMSSDFNFFCDLRLIRPGEIKVITADDLAAVAPLYWNNERVISQADWFIERGPTYGLQIVARAGYFLVSSDPAPAVQ